MNPEFWAPFPTTMEGCRKEIEYLQKELFIWNAKLPNPSLEKNLILDSWSDVDMGQETILQGRRKLIKMRSIWLDVTFKKVHNGNRGNLKGGAWFL